MIFPSLFTIQAQPLEFLLRMIDTDSIFRNIDSEQEHLDGGRAFVTRTMTWVFFPFPLLIPERHSPGFFSWLEKRYSFCSLLCRTIFILGILLFRGLAQPQMAFHSHSSLTLVDAISLLGDWLIKITLSEISLLFLLFFSPQWLFWVWNEARCPIAQLL